MGWVNRLREIAAKLLEPAHGGIAGRLGRIGRGGSMLGGTDPRAAMTVTTATTTASATLGFTALADALERANAVVGTAECHGLLCGLLCGDPVTPLERWVGEVLPDPEPGDQPTEEIRAVLVRLHRQTAAQLASPGMDFTPVLPGDEASLRERGAAFTAWCGGFLYGLGLSGLDLDQALDPEAREFVTDLADMARLETESLETGEEDEAALAELVEYVRVGVLLVNRMPLATDDASGSLH